MPAKLLKSAKPAKTKAPLRGAAAKAITPDNLVGLGASRLAAILLDLADDHAPIKKRLRLELIAAAGGDDLAAEIGKRIAAIGKARSFLDSKKTSEVAGELSSLLAMIRERLVASHPQAAFDLVDRFVGTMNSVLERSGDGSARLSLLFGQALQAFAEIAAKARPETNLLIDRLVDIFGNQRYGFALIGTLPKIHPLLGPEGAAALRGALQAALAKRSSKFDEMRMETRSLRSALVALADLDKDVDAFVAALKPEELMLPHYGSAIAQRMLTAGRPAEAMAALERSRAAQSQYSIAFSLSENSEKDDEADPWNAAYLAVLEASGKDAQAQKHRWHLFERWLSVGYLKAFLKALPDFEDDAAERKALAYVAGHQNFWAALAFLIRWNAADRAAELVMSRHRDIDGNINIYPLLDPAAGMLEAKHPVAATLLRRAVIEYTLKNGKSSHYQHMARHFMQCAALAEAIKDDARLTSHATFAAEIRKAHGRKPGFWQELGALGG